jgi:UDP-N-acetylmuramoyl-tripeptide--D-alanyl-D-alanine ligase
VALSFTDDQVMRATGATRARKGDRATYTAVCTDSRHLEADCLFVALKGERFDGHDFLEAVGKGGATGVIVNRGQVRRGPDPHVTVFEVDDTLAALGGLARAWRRTFKIPIGAVTGSNGKTTTKELIAAILATRGPVLKTEGNLNNEIGVPLTLFRLEPKHVAGIVEMGMNHKGEIGRLTSMARPDAGLITIVQPAHLEGLGSIQGVAEAKGELFKGLEGHATAVVNLDDERIVEQAKLSGAKTLTWGRAPLAQVRLVKVEPHGREGLAVTIRFKGTDYPIALRLIGDHNAMNATGAFALALALGYQPDECVRGLEAAQAHARRLQVLEAPGGVTVVDDCYNANPASMKAALEALGGLSIEGRPIAVLGDMLELGKDELKAHEQMGVHASDLASRVAFFGTRMKAAFNVAQKKLLRNAAHFDNVELLVDWISNDLKSGDVVLVKGSRGMRLERVVDALIGKQPGGVGDAH